MVGRVACGESLHEEGGVDVGWEDMVCGDGFEESDVAVSGRDVGGGEEGLDARVVVEAGEG